LRNTFTPEEDAVISSSGSDELAVTAERLGRSTSVVGKRRKRLLGISEATPPAVQKRRNRAHHNTRVKRVQSLATLARFARPSWFEENLTAMTKGAL
jgi:hypothetical protein